MPATPGFVCRAGATMSVVFFEDPHGTWEPLLSAVREERPDAVVLLGDCYLTRPLHEELAELFGAGIPVGYIYGNHERDLPMFWDNLVGDHPAGGMHARVTRIGGFDIAAVAGVFKGRIWLPPSPPVVRSRADLLRGLSHQRRWRRGVPLRQRDAIFPEDLSALAGRRADVLVCHEAPASHPLGFAVLDDLARDLRVRLIVFGHHHVRAEGVTADGIRTVGLAKAEVFRLRAGELP